MERAKRRRSKIYQHFAEQHGLDYTTDDHYDIHQELTPGLGPFDRWHIRNVIRFRRDDDVCFLFSNISKSGTGMRIGKRTTRHRIDEYTSCLIDTKQELLNGYIGISIRRRVGAFVRLGDPQFHPQKVILTKIEPQIAVDSNREFEIRTDSPEMAQQIVNARVQQYLLSHDQTWPITVVISDSKIIIGAPLLKKAEDLDYLFNFARRLRDMLL